MLRLDDAVSIHAPREGCDFRLSVLEFRDKFQFTHPGRGATFLIGLIRVLSTVSIHAPREGCDCIESYPIMDNKDVSIHAPREGCDSAGMLVPCLVRVSIHAPREGCDKIINAKSFTPRVSIHAPREGCDGLYSPSHQNGQSFNSRTPGGVRQVKMRLRVIFPRFQFTHPGRGATCNLLTNCYTESVSIHAPREGCDVRTLLKVSSLQSFNSRPPGGVRLQL